MQQESRSGIDNECRNAGSGSEDENKAARSKSSRENEKVRCVALAHLEESGLVEQIMRTGVRDVAENGLCPCERVERTGLVHCAHRKIAVEKADGGSSRQERVCCTVSFHGGE